MNARLNLYPIVSLFFAGLLFLGGGCFVGAASDGAQNPLLTRKQSEVDSAHRAIQIQSLRMRKAQRSLKTLKRQARKASSTSRKSTLRKRIKRASRTLAGARRQSSSLRVQLLKLSTELGDLRKVVANLYILPATHDTPLLGATVNLATGAAIFVTTSDTVLFGERIVEAIDQIVVKGASGYSIFRFDASGVPYELELPDGQIIGFDTGSPELDPTIPGVSTALFSSAWASEGTVAFSTGGGLRDSFLLIPNTLPKNLHASSDSLGMANIVGPIAELVQYQRRNLDRMLANVIGLASRSNPAAGVLKQLLDARDAVFDLADSLDRGITASQTLLDVGGIQTGIPGWWNSLSNLVSSHPKQGTTSLAASQAEKTWVRWDATVSYPRDPSITDDIVWAEMIVHVRQSLQLSSANDVIFTMGGFTVFWKGIGTYDFSATQAEMRALYSTPPARLNGPWLSIE